MFPEQPCRQFIILHDKKLPIALLMEKSFVLKVVTTSFVVAIEKNAQRVAVVKLSKPFIYATNAINCVACPITVIVLVY